MKPLTYALLLTLPLLLLLGAPLLCPLQPAQAHDLRPGVLAMREVAPDRFALRLTPAQDGSGTPVSMVPQLPEPCRFEPEGIHCPGGLQGTLKLPELADRRAKALIHIRWHDGSSFEHLLMEGEHALLLPTTATLPPSSTTDTLGRWLLHGLTHMLAGLDHLLFVLGLALVARHPTMLALAVTGFTVAHSLTLGASALRWIAAPSSATELVIALSILLLAAEAAHHERDTLTARRPWLVAFLFGLIHGLGFAGVIAERGLPQDHLLTALLGFNLGVELGQLIVLAAALLMAALLRPRLSEAGRDRAHLLAAYAIGIPAGVWVVERAVDWAIHLTRS